MPARGWQRITARYLTRVLATPTADPVAFRWSSAHWLRHRDVLREMARQASTLRSPGLATSHPILATIEAYARAESPSAIATLLMRIVFEHHLRGSQPSSAVLATAECLRGVLGGHGVIERAIGGAATVGELVASMELLREQADDGAPLTGHRAFDHLWRTDLKTLCERLLVPVPEPDELEGDDEAGQPLDKSQACEADGKNADPLLAETPVTATKGLSPGEPVPAPRDRKAEADARYLDSQSRAEIFRHPEHILPTAIAQGIWQGACGEARRAIDQGNVRAAEGQIGLLLAIEAGVTEGELRRIGFGASASPSLLALDLAGHALRRPEVRPPDAWEPGSDDESLWRPTGGDLVFPLSADLVALGEALLQMRPGDCSLLVSETEPTVDRLIRHALNQVMPGSQLPVSSFRWRIAAGIAQQLGLDAAQLAFGDEFGSSGAGAYYGRHEVATIAITVWGISRRITGAPESPPSAFVEPAHAIGSRACPSNPKPLQHMSAPPERKRGRPNDAALPMEWRKHADHVARHLLLVTAHRPNTALARVTLRDFAPEHCLVILADKESDPAHMTRVASTGRTFVVALAAYVAFLESMTRRITPVGGAQVARAILMGDAPLFRSVSEDGSALDLDVPALILGLPQPWQDKPNLQRHLLNNALVGAGVDPELRYFQLGWMTGQAHATSPVSPYPAIEACSRLAMQLDQALQSLGWPQSSTEVMADAIGPRLPLTDWSAVVDKHTSDHARRVRELIALLAERRGEALEVVEGALATLIAQEMPGFEYVEIGPRSKRRIRPISEQSPGVIHQSQVEAVLEHFTQEPHQPIHRHVAAAELARLLADGIRNHRFKAYVPPVQKLLLSSEPSPFPLGAGNCLRQAGDIREGTIELARKFGAAAGATDLVCIAWLAVMSMTRYRAADVALQIVNNARNASASEAQPTWLRVPLDGGHAFVSGGAGLALLRLAGHRTEEPPAVLDRKALAAFLRTHLTALCAAGGTGDPIDLIEQTLRMAARFELSGIARTSMLLESQQATVSSVRAATVVDHLSVREASAPVPLAEQGDDVIAEGDIPDLPNPGNRPTTKHATPDILRFLSRDFAGQIDDLPAKPAKQRRPQILAATLARFTAAGSRLSVDAALLSYAVHLLQEGGPRSAGGLKLSSIHTMLGRISRPLLAGDPGGDVRAFDRVRVTTLYLMVVLRAPRRIRARVLGELFQFHKHLAATYGIESPEWPVLRHHAGARSDGVDPGIVGDHELRLAIAVLTGDLELGLAETGMPPVQLRLHECQLVGALLAEASGGRPSSLHGLTLADIYCTDGGDFVHFHASGRFGSIKTATSSGFIPLRGETWQEHRAWFQGWLHARRESAPGPLYEIPLFQIPQADPGQRYRVADVFGRVGQLLRWATCRESARAYWLRKRGIQRRQRDVRLAAQPTARDAYRAMREGGHVLIDTELQSYLCDPACFDDGGMTLLADLARGSMAALSGLPEKVLDRRWQAVGKASELDVPTRVRLAYLAMSPPSTRQEGNDRGPPPPFVAPSRTRGIVWVGEVLAGLCQRRPKDWILGRTGATNVQLQRAREALSQLSVRTGLDIGDATGLNPPRATPSATRLMGLLKDWSADLASLSVEWASLARQVPSDAGLPLLEFGYAELLGGVLRPLGFSLIRTEAKDLPIYLPTEGDGSQPYGLWPALRWVLAVAWVARKIGLECQER